MAKLKCPKKLLRLLLDYIKEWLSTLLEVIVSHDQSGLYSSEILKVLEHVQNYLEPFIPLDIAESMIEDIFVTKLRRQNGDVVASHSFLKAAHNIERRKELSQKGAFFRNGYFRFIFLLFVQTFL